MTEPQRDPVITAQGLTAALQSMTGQLAALKKRSRTDRHLIVAAFVSLALDIGLTVAISLVAIQAHDASSSATQTRASNLAACRATNAARAQNRQLWDYLLSESRPAPGATAREKAADEKLLAELGVHINRAFKPAACGALYGRQ